MAWFYLVTAVSLAILIFWLARKVTVIPVDSYSTKILMSLVIGATLLIIGLLLVTGTVFLYKIFVYGSARLDQALAFIMIVTAPLVLLSSFISPAASIKNKLAVSPLLGGSMADEIMEIVHRLDIRNASLFTSEKITSPLLFGSSSNVRLVLPSGWQIPIGESEMGMIYHELAHVINKDTGFMTWAWILLRRTHVAGVVLCLAGVCLFLFLNSFLLIFFSLFKYFVAYFIVMEILYSVISRKREILADKIASLYYGVIQVAYPLGHVFTGFQQLASPRNKLRNYFSDKALFGKLSLFWKVLYQIYSYSSDRHPAQRERGNVLDNNLPERTVHALPSKEVTAWLGIAIGLVVSFIILLYQLSQYQFINALTSSHVAVKTFFIVNLFIASAMTIILCLPGCLAIYPVTISWKYIKLLIVRFSMCYVVAVAAAGLLVIGLPGWKDSLALFLTELRWLVIVFLYSFYLVLLFVTLMPTLIHSIDRTMREIPYTLMICSIPLSIVLLTAGLGFYMLFTGGIVLGGALVVSSGLSIVPLALFDMFVICASDRYVFMHSPGSKKVWWFEGKLISLEVMWRATTVMLPVILASFGVIFCVTYLPVKLVWQNPNGFFYSMPVIFILISCMLFLVNKMSSRLIFEKRDLVYGLARCLTLSGFNVPENIRKALTKLDMAIKWHTLKQKDRPEHVWETVRHFNLIIQIISLAEDKLNGIFDLKGWVLQCANETGGYGLWPGAGSRLSSTYYALGILCRLKQDFDVDKAKCIEWIINCQQPSGWFESPLSGRPDWENTYFAVSSLAMLDGISQMKHRREAEEWLHKTMYDGILHSDIHKVYCCGISLNLLGELNEHDKKALRDFIVKSAPRLLHSKIRYVAEQIAEVLELGKIVMNDQELKNLFPDLELRLESALEAELKPLIKREKSRIKKQATA